MCVCQCHGRSWHFKCQVGPYLVAAVTARRVGLGLGIRPGVADQREAGAVDDHRQGGGGQLQAVDGVRSLEGRVAGVGGLPLAGAPEQQQPDDPAGVAAASMRRLSALGGL